jgi:hypothetical protein
VYFASAMRCVAQTALTWMRLHEPFDVRLQQLLLQPAASSSTKHQQLTPMLQQQRCHCHAQQMLQ